MDAYDKYQQTINSTGNTFDVQIEVQILDENPGVRKQHKLIIQK